MTPLKVDQQQDSKEIYCDVMRSITLSEPPDVSLLVSLNNEHSRLLSASPPTGSCESQNVVTTPPPFPTGSSPVKMICPECGDYVKTEVRQAPTLKAIVACSIMMVLFLWCFCWIPLCMKRCKEDVHMCPKCEFAFKYDKRNK
ncbi:lipopolysaccharide-induced tumor necrosis factor-alpha factor homolog [Symsagittifera roscoffensis]|uniref:lipopolysaccharide-induced tumor necrosis factor-alpha factor homolog n=1 Tax=Symsagittifera roscoffensis TaxID=84072 RepID=UPI00307B8F44